MALEIEAKIKVDSLDPTARRLGELGAQHIAERVQSDAYFLDADGRLARSGCGLRLRTETVEGQTVSVLTFKGPRQDGLYKSRPEYETLVVEPETMTRILEGLGYRSHLIVTKTRRVWTLDGCEVCLDSVPPLGCFIEVEGPDEAAITNVLTRLNLGDRPHIADGYAAMMARCQKK